MKVFKIFLRDLKINIREFLTLIIMLFPIIAAILINVLTPGITDTPISVVLLKSDSSTNWYSKYAKVEQVDTYKQLTDRIMKRDDIIGIYNNDIIIQGNEIQGLVDSVKLLKYYNEKNINISGDSVKILSLGRTTPPIKAVLIAGLIIMITILSGMMIANNIVDEKVDRTIKAMRVTPLSVNSFVVGKSLIGIFNTIVITILVMLISGYGFEHFAQILLVAVASSFISFVVGFLAGMQSEDFIGATASIKMLFIPAIFPIIAVEMLAAKYQPFFYWSPFYWAYDAIKGSLTGSISLGKVLFDCLIIVVISLIIFIVLRPKLKKELA